MFAKINDRTVENENLSNYLIDKEIQEFWPNKMNSNTEEFYDDDSPYSGTIFFKIGGYDINIFPDTFDSIISGGSNNSPLKIIFN